MKSSKTISTYILFMFILTNQHVLHILTVYIYTREADDGDDDIVVTGEEKNDDDEDRISQLLYMSIFVFLHLNLLVGSYEENSMYVQLE